MFGYTFTSRYEGCVDTSNTNYALAVMNNFAAGRNTSVQFDANVVGPAVLTQGREKGYCYFDLALRQSLFGNRVTAAVVAHDVFRTARYRNSRITPTLVSATHVRPKYPNIVFSLGYTFNAAGRKEHTGTVSSGAVFEGKDF